MSNASRHAAYLVPEVTRGTTPANPAWERVRHNSMTLGVQRGSLQSQELDPTRQIRGFRLGSHSVTGDIGVEMTFGSFDRLLVAALMASDWIDKGNVSGITISAAAADDSFNDTGNGFTADKFAVDDLILVTGFDTPGNNGVFKIAARADGKITVTNPDGTAAAGIVNEVAGDDIDVTTLEQRIKAGTTRHYFSFLRHFTDIAAAGEGKPYHVFNGVEVNTLAVSITPEAIVSATFGCLGREGVAPANAAPAGSTYGDPTTTQPIDAFTGELRDGATVIGVATEITFNLENGLAPIPVVGSQFSINPSEGMSNLTGTVSVYFEDASFLTKFSEETPLNLTFELPDGAGNYYVFYLPRLVITAAQPDVSGQGPILLSLPFQGLKDETLETNIMIARKPADAE